MNELKAYEQQLIQLEDQIQKRLETDEEQSTITANKMQINGQCFINTIDVNLINGVTIHDVQDNVFDLDEGFEIDNDVQFQTVEALKPIIFNTVNNVTKNNIIHTNDNVELPELSVDGNVECKSHLTVAETINNIRFDSENVLLKDGDQNFSDFSVARLVAKNVSADNFEDSQPHDENVVTSVEEMKVKDLRVGGYMNGVKIITLNKYALRNAGDQNILVPCYFNNLQLDSLDTEILSGKE